MGATALHFLSFLTKNLLRRRTRSVLTICGVAVAMGTTVSLLGISDGFERSSLESLEVHGVDILVVEADVLDLLSSDLPESAAKWIALVPGVDRISAGLVEPVAFTTESGEVVTLVANGWQPGSFAFEDLKVLKGRAFRSGQAECMLGKSLAERIDRDVGDTVDVQREDFLVVGIYESFNMQENGALIAPLDYLQQSLARDGSVTGFSIQLRPEGQRPSVEEICLEIEALTDADGQPLHLAAEPTEEFVRGAIHIRMAHSMALMTSAIALLVGTIGMLNTMVMSVVERIREISILRAIGWRKSRIVSMIVGESILLSMAGAVVGTIAAIAVVRWLTTLPEFGGFLTGEIAAPVVVKGFLMASMVGVLGGVYPAYRAARLLPIEGLRHE